MIVVSDTSLLTALLTVNRSEVWFAKPRLSAAESLPGFPTESAYFAFHLGSWGSRALLK